MHNPGLHRLLCSNVAPNPCEASFIRLQTDDINSQISGLRSQLTELEDQLRLHRAVLSPVRRMPAEILGEIFAHSLPDVSQSSSRQHLVNIQLVCKSWRDAARLTHRLWGALSFHNLTHAPYEKVQQWFRRAGRTPKSFAFSATDHNDCSDQSFGCGSLQSTALAILLVSLEGTVDHLTLDYKGPQCFQNLLDSLGAAAEGPASIQRRSWHPLKSFTLKFDEEWNVSPDPLQSMFHHLPPHITSFELYLPHKWSDAFVVDSDSDRAPLPLPQSLLEQLSSFTLGCSWDGTRWLDATLAHCVNVETLTLDSMGTVWIFDNDDPDTERIMNPGLLLPKVRTLRLRNIYPPSITLLFALNTPQLVELDVHFEPDEQEVCWVESQLFFPFISQSDCDTTLHLLHLRNAYITIRELTDLLFELPSLTHISLDSVVVDTGASLIDALIAPEDSPEPLLPNLETLELLQLRPDFPSHRLLAFLKSRIPYRIENEQPVFKNPQDPFKRLNVMYQSTKGENQELDGSEVVEVLRKRRGVYLNIGPTFHVD